MSRGLFDRHIIAQDLKKNKALQAGRKRFKDEELAEFKFPVF